MVNKQQQKIIITIILCVTFLFAGWTAGSSLGYKRGFAESERLNVISQLDSKRALSEETQILVRAAARARHDLLIRYKNIPDRDFATIMAAHQKTSALLCKDYQEFAKAQELIMLCQEDIIPTVKKVRYAIDDYLLVKGLN